MSCLLNCLPKFMSMAKWLDYPPATQEVGGSYPTRFFFFFQFFISFSFWSMTKYLENPIATQEVGGSNPRRVIYC